MNTKTTFTHRPVLLDECVEALNIRPDGVYLDATFGRGGHAAAILARLGPEGRLLATDKDPQAIEVAHERFGDDARFHIFHGSFAEMGEFVASVDLAGKVDGVLLDLGVSSPQLDDAERGFSFMRDGPLDMRMDTTQGMSAAEWLADAKEADITHVIKKLGEERFGKRIAHAIVTAREETPIVRTGQLAQLVTDAVPVKEKDKHPATRTFQAIRIFINRELDDLKIALEQALSVLSPGGRMAVISFHSLEDRISKRFMREEARGGDFPIGLPVTADQFNPCLKTIGRAIRPSREEVDENPRARSSVLRIAEKL